jgi:lipopolysaccharide/colanic/teichoic acid biosynthesis glycosyltransferase
MIWKRSEDIAIMVIGHLALLLIWIFVWIAIPLAILIFDGRPLFYCRYRIGKNLKTFAVRKFRTMVVDADSTGPVRTATDDQRVRASVGCYVRRHWMNCLRCCRFGQAI